MKQAGPEDRSHLINILCQSFDQNKSVNYIVKQDRNRKARIKGLMEYSYDMCQLFGEVVTNNEKNCCALLLYPDKKKSDFKTQWMDLKLAFSVIGITRIRKIMKRENLIHSYYPENEFLYLWFIGVSPDMQGKGFGTKFLNQIIRKGINENKRVYLETSVSEIVPWYEMNGFEVYKQLDFGYTLNLMRTRNNV